MTQDCPSRSKVVNTVATGIGYSAAIKLRATRGLACLPAWISRNFFRETQVGRLNLIAPEYPIPGATVLTTFLPDGQALIVINDQSCRERGLKFVVFIHSIWDRGHRLRP